MSFPRYPEYKDSGVEWLGEVPAHWTSPPMYLRYQIELGKMLDAKRNSGASPLPYLRNVDVQWDRINVSDLPTMDIGTEEIERYTVRVGDLLVCEGGEIGRAAIWTGELAECGYQKALHRLRPLSDEDDPRFLRYVLRFASTLGVFEANGNPNTIPHLTGEAFRLYRFPKPSRDEQLRIVEFLDRETAKIDALMAEQEQLIALLKEKRQAMSSHAVTKGLNPDAPMRDSGVEWLGEVPVHWEIGPVKRFFVSRNERRVPLSAEERSVRRGEYPYYGASGIIDFVDDYLFEEDLVLVSEDGANLLSRSTPIAFTATGRFWVNNHAHILRAPDRNTIFWTERLESIDLVPFVTGSAQPKLTSEALQNLVIAIPPDEAERANIQEYLASRIAESNELTTQVAKSIALLQEWRSSLITAAVTGQIDVREFALRDGT